MGEGWAGAGTDRSMDGIVLSSRHWIRSIIHTISVFNVHNLGRFSFILILQMKNLRVMEAK